MSVYIVLEEGFEEIEALAVADILRRAEIECFLVSARNNDYVTGSHAITVKADKKINEIADYEMIVFPGGYPGYENLENNDNVKKLITNAFENNKYIAAICAAPSILGKWGILKGKKACCFTSFEHFLEGSTVTFDKVTHDDKIITSRGAGTAHNFAFKLVEILKSKEIADKLEKTMLYE